MKLLFFAVPAREPEAAQEELNASLARHRVVSVDAQLVAAGEASFWAVRVTAAATAGELPDALKPPERRSPLWAVRTREGGCRAPNAPREPVSR